MPAGSAPPLGDTATGSLGSRLVLATVGFCMLFALLTVAVRTWSAWHGNVSAMRGELDLLDQVYQRPLSKAIWEMDRDLLKTHVASAANVAANKLRLGLKKTVGKITQPVNAPSRFAEYDAFETAIHRHLAAHTGSRPRILDVGSPKLFGLHLACTRSAASVILRPASAMATR